MHLRLPSLLAALLCLGPVCLAQAQGLRLPGASTSAAASTAVPAAAAVQQADFIVAVVNSEPITNHEVSQEIERQLQMAAQQRRTTPPRAALAAEVLEALINRRAQVQMAQDMGMQVEDSAIDEAEQSVALQNQMDVPQLRRRLQQDGQTPAQFRSQLGEQLLLQRLREREVDARVRVSEADIDQFLAEQQASATGPAEINLANILIAVPETASPAQEQALRARAQRALERARKGEDFAALVREFSDASDLANGGQLGIRPTSRYPELFVSATQNLQVGEVADLVRSGAGFHVLKVIEKVRPGMPTLAVTQSRARHILLIPGAKLSQEQARRQLADYKLQVVNRQADFAELARQHSQDGSAAQGGDLGWASPGMFVPEFEAVMNRLAPGEVSDPLQSRFGMHLIQLLERRKASLSPAQQREAVRAMLRDRKLAEALRTWTQDVRARAYVEMREPPQ